MDAAPEHSLGDKNGSIHSVSGKAYPKAASSGHRQNSPNVSLFDYPGMCFLLDIFRNRIKFTINFYATVRYSFPDSVEFMPFRALHPGDSLLAYVCFYADKKAPLKRGASVNDRNRLLTAKTNRVPKLACYIILNAANPGGLTRLVCCTPAAAHGQTAVLEYSLNPMDCGFFPTGANTRKTKSRQPALPAVSLV